METISNPSLLMGISLITNAVIAIAIMYLLECAVRCFTDSLEHICEKMSDMAQKTTSTCSDIVRKPTKDYEERLDKLYLTINEINGKIQTQAKANDFFEKAINNLKEGKLNDSNSKKSS